MKIDPHVTASAPYASSNKADSGVSSLAKKIGGISHLISNNSTEAELASNSYTKGPAGDSCAILQKGN